MGVWRGWDHNVCEGVMPVLVSGGWGTERM